MRIISKFKDYYDCIQSYGQSDVIYIRNQETFGDEERYRITYDDVHVFYNTIGFCGKFYKAITIKNAYNKTYGTFYDIDSVDRFFTNHMNKKDNKTYFEKYIRKSGPYISYRWYRHKDKRAARPEIDDYFNHPKSQIKYSPEIFRKYNTPIIVFHYGLSYYTKDARLQDYDFAKKFDAYLAFQELEMYIGGILGGYSRPIPEVSDSDLLQAKGFDKKWSFRKEPKNENS